MLLNDTVLIVGPGERDDKRWNPDMFKYVGKQATIVCVYKYGILVSTNDFIWDDTWLKRIDCNAAYSTAMGII